MRLRARSSRSLFAQIEQRARTRRRRWRERAAASNNERACACQATAAIWRFAPQAACRHFLARSLVRRAALIRRAFAAATAADRRNRFRRARSWRSRLRARSPLTCTPNSRVVDMNCAKEEAAIFVVIAAAVVGDWPPNRPKKCRALGLQQARRS